MKKQLLTIILIFAVSLVPLTMRAATATDLAATISSFTGGVGGSGSLTAIANDNYTVTVTGTLTTDATTGLALDIDADVTVIWQAEISTGSGYTGNQLIYLPGAGTFNVATGGNVSTAEDGVAAIISTGTTLIMVSGTGIVRATGDGGTAIGTNGNVEVSGGEVSATTGFAINAWSVGASVTVSAGIVQATGGTAIGTNGNVEVSGGEVSATTGSAISTWSSNSTVNITDGTISVTTGNAINTGGSLTVSGSGIVQATGNGGTAINASGNVDVNGGEISVTTGCAINAGSASSTLTVSAGIVQATGDGGKAINSGGSLTVSGSGIVQATGDGSTAILTSGNVEVSGGEVSATTGFAINSWTSDPTVISINGGTISVTTGNAISTGGSVTISGTGIVQATGNGGTAINASGNVDVNGGEVSATTGIAIAANGASSTITVGGGSVSATTGSAINAWPVNATVTITGGTISSATTSTTTIYTINAGGIGSTVTISGTGKVQATGDGTAINAGGSVTVSGSGIVQATDDGGTAIGASGNAVEIDGGEVSATTGWAINAWGGNPAITITGGTVSATTGYAITANGASSTVTVSNGLVFAYGDAVTGSGNVIFLPNNSSGFTDATGTGVVVAWNQAAGTTIYSQGTSTDLSQSPVSATVQWDINGADFGISYANGANTGFIPLSVTVKSSACDVASVASPAGATITGQTITASVANSVASQAVSLTTSPGASWKLFSDAACTNEITNKTMSLSVGDNTAYIQVTAEDGTTTKVYKIVVTREEESIPPISPVSLSLTASAGANFNDDITLTAVVSPLENGATPTGTITFKEGDSTLATLPLDDSGASTYIVPSPFNVGSYTYTAEYSGDDNYNANSATATVEVPVSIFVSPNYLNFIAAGETKPVTVMCNSTWSLASSASWATINSSNDGSYTMLVTATPNPDATQRTMLFTFWAGTDMKTLRVTQDAADATAIRQAETPFVIVYAQDGNVVVKSDAPVQRVAVYDVSGKLLKQLKGGNRLITISGLPEQQVMIVKVTSYELRVTSYELQVTS